MGTLKSLTIGGVTNEVPIEKIIEKIGDLDTEGIATNGTVATKNGVIGERKDNTASVRIATANTPTKGASVTLATGKYVVVAGFTYMAPSSTGGRFCNTSIYLNSTGFLTNSVQSSDNSTIASQVTGTVEVAEGASTEVSVYGQSTKTTTTAGTTYVRTIRIA